MRALERGGRRLALAGGDVGLAGAPAHERGGVGALDRLPRLRRGLVQRRVGLAVGARVLGLGAAQPRVLDGAAVLGGRARAAEVELGLHERAAALLVVAEVAGALGRVGLDDHADGRHAGQAHDVVGAGLDAVERAADRRARGLEVAGAALELGAQRAHDAEELRLVDVDRGGVDLGRAAPAPASASPWPRASSAWRRAKFTKVVPVTGPGSGRWRSAKTQSPVSSAISASTVLTHALLAAGAGGALGALVGDGPALLRAPALVQEVGEVDVGRAHLGQASVGRPRARAPRAACRRRGRPRRGP